MADDVVAPLGFGGVKYRTLAQASGQKWPVIVPAKVISQISGNNTLGVIRDITPCPVVERDANGAEIARPERADSSSFSTGQPGIPMMFVTAISALPANSSGVAVPRMTINRDLSIALRKTNGSVVGTAGNPIITKPGGAVSLPVSDGGGSITIDDGGGVIPVSGVVSVTAGSVTANAGTGPFPVAGLVAHGQAVSGNPVISGSEAHNTDGPSIVTNGQAARAHGDSLGKDVLLFGAPHSLWSSGLAQLTTTAAVNVLAAPGAGLRWVVVSISAKNAHATISSKVLVAGGTSQRVQGSAGAGGSGFVYGRGKSPVLIGGVNLPITATALTNGADIDVFVSAYKIAN